MSRARFDPLINYECLEQIFPMCGWNSREVPLCKGRPWGNKEFVEHFLHPVSKEMTAGHGHDVIFARVRNHRVVLDTLYDDKGDGGIRSDSRYTNLLRSGKMVRHGFCVDRRPRRRSQRWSSSLCSSASGQRSSSRRKQPWSKQIFLCALVYPLLAWYIFLSRYSLNPYSAVTYSQEFSNALDLDVRLSSSVMLSTSHDYFLRISKDAHASMVFAFFVRLQSVKITFNFQYLYSRAF